MTRAPGEPAILTSQDITLIRQVLVASSGMLAWARHYGGPQLREVLSATAETAVGCRVPDWLETQVNLAIDCLDFAAAASPPQQAATREV